MQIFAPTAIYEARIINGKGICYFPVRDNVLGKQFCDIAREAYLDDEQIATIRTMGVKVEIRNARSWPASEVDPARTKRAVTAYQLRKYPLMEPRYVLDVA